MSADARERGSTVAQARASYEEAFHALAREVAALRELRAGPEVDQGQLSEARARVEAAEAAYVESRNLLAELLLARAVQSGGSEGSADERSRVQRLAHLLWESGGRPEGHAEADWYRAERLIQMISASAA